MLEKLKSILYENTGIENLEISNESNLKNDLGLNSLDLVELACAVEEDFDVEIPDSSIKDFKTVGDVMNFLKENEAYDNKH